MSLQGSLTRLQILPLSRKTDREVAVVGAATEEAMKVTVVGTEAMDSEVATITIEAVTKEATEATIKGTDRTGITMKATGEGMMPVGDTLMGTEATEGMIKIEEAKKVTEGIIKVAEAVRIGGTKGLEEGSRRTKLGAKTTRHSGLLTSREAAIRTINSPDKAASEVVEATNKIHRDSSRRKAIGPVMIEVAAPSSRRARQETLVARTKSRSD